MMRHWSKPLFSSGSMILVLAASLSIPACKKQETGDGAPPEAQVTHVSDMNLISVDPSKTNLFPIQKAEKVEEASQLTAPGSVTADVSRTVPVISLANGRVVDIKARLDDYVKKGDLLLKVQSPDVAGAYNTYLKAANDEHLANTAYLRAKELFDHGAIAQSMLDQAEDTEKDAQADLNAAEENLKTLGVDKNHPSSVVNVYAPISGVIVAQNVTQDAAAGVTLSGSATAFTIADLSTVWVVCDVFENDIAKLRVGQSAQIHINAYPDKILTGRIGNIGPVLDPSIRTAKVRIEVRNPGFLKLGMFATVTFEGSTKQTVAVVPATAVLHLHDRDWVFLPAGGNQFKRTEVHAGRMLENGRQEISSGLEPGQPIVANALALETEGDQ